MGISDDIKPKKVSRFVEHPIYISQKETEKEKVELEEPEPDEELDKSESELKDFYNEDSNKKEHLEDVFFSNKKEEQPAKFPIPKKKHRPLKRVIVIVIVLILCALIVYQNLDVIKSYFVKQSPSTTQSNAKDKYYAGEQSQTPTDSSTNSATSNNSSAQATTQPSAPATTATVEVLNGNGISGSAEKIKTTLTNAGITVSKVANAKRFTYTQTYIYYATGFSDQANNLKNILSSNTVTVTQSDDIASQYNIVVVVGKK